MTPHVLTVAAIVLVPLAALAVWAWRPAWTRAGRDDEVEAADMRRGVVLCPNCRQPITWRDSHACVRDLAASTRALHEAHVAEVHADDDGSDA